jgi:hypothetical protein
MKMGRTPGGSTIHGLKEGTMRLARFFSPAVLAGVALALAPMEGCDNGPIGVTPDAATADVATVDVMAEAPGSDDASGDDGPSMGDDADATPTLACIASGQCVHACNGQATTLSGTVYDPAGRHPLYGVAVYVPSTAPAPLMAGASCATCADLYTGSPIAFGITDPTGHFSIANVPDGTDIPVVIQIGKWRKQIVVPTVAACAETALPDGSVTLPKNKNEGDIPSIAIATGGADTLECLLGRIGLDPSEYGPGADGAGHVHVFHGDQGADTVTPSPTASVSLWATKDDLMKFDIVLLACQGHETTAMNQQALFDYAAAGGRVFASHFQYSWFNTGPFGAANLALWMTDGNLIGDIGALVQTIRPSGELFPRGAALMDWLGAVGALDDLGELPIQAARHNADVSATNTAALPWLAADRNSPAPGATESFSFDTPLGADPQMQCGRVVYTDMHVGAGSQDYGWNGFVVPTNSVVPTGCANTDLSPQEKALEFMLFDLSACVSPPEQGTGGSFGP